MSQEKQTQEPVRTRAMKLFRPPFKFDGTYIWDAQGEMLAWNHMPDGAVLMVRGWGRLIGQSAMSLPKEEAEELQRACGELIAEALSAHWGKQAPQTQEEK